MNVHRWEYTTRRPLPDAGIDLFGNQNTISYLHENIYLLFHTCSGVSSETVRECERLNEHGAGGDYRPCCNLCWSRFLSVSSQAACRPFISSRHVSGQSSWKCSAMALAASLFLSTAAT